MGAEIHSSYGICFTKFYIPPQFCKAGSGFRSESDLDLHKKTGSGSAKHDCGYTALFSSMI